MKRSSAVVLLAPLVVAACDNQDTTELIVQQEVARAAQQYSTDKDCARETGDTCVSKTINSFHHPVLVYVPALHNLMYSQTPLQARPYAYAPPLIAPRPSTFGFGTTARAISLSVAS
jgi:hypothetical protein